MSDAPGGSAGRPAPATAGDSAGERHALLAGSAVVDRSAAGRLALGGADRARFLNGQVTCDVRGLGDGQGAYGFLTSVQGRVLADLVVLALADRLWVELPPGLDGEVAAHLRKYIIADRVELGPLDAARPLALAGPGAADLLERALGFGELPRAPWAHRPGRLGAYPVRAVRRGVAPVAWFDLWAAPGDAEGVGAALRGAGAVAVGERAVETLRVERGLPRFGAEFGPANFPQETGLEEQAVSYEKGCYLGQEVVARIHYRGGVNKALRGLRFADVGGPPVHGTRLLAEGREAGTVGTAVESPAEGLIGLAVLHQRAAQTGTVVEVAGGGRAVVVDLPFRAG
jgi:folate-binding protein YgfZ